MEHSWPFKTPDFGNTWLENAAEVTAPESISWLPATPLGYGLGLLLTLLLLRYLLAQWRTWKLNSYRRSALQHLKQLRVDFNNGDRDCIRQLPSLLRQCALEALPRQQVVALHDKDWQRFLLDTCPTAASPAPDYLDKLLQLAYVSPQYRQSLSEQQANGYFDWCEHWFVHHQPLANGGRP